MVVKVQEEEGDLRRKAGDSKFVDVVLELGIVLASVGVVAMAREGIIKDDRVLELMLANVGVDAIVHELARGVRIGSGG